jgi:hypothetical protein
VSPSLLIYCLTKWNAEKFVKKFFGENEVDVILQRLDRLTQDEARTTAAQTLEVVYGLVQNMRVVIDGKSGKRIALVCNRLPLSILPSRQQDIG